MQETLHQADKKNLILNKGNIKRLLLRFDNTWEKYLVVKFDPIADSELFQSGHWIAEPGVNFDRIVVHHTVFLKRQAVGGYKHF